MADMEVGILNFDDDDKGVYVASSTPSLQVSVSFGRFEADSLSWEKFSAFSPNKYLEEVGKCATPGSVAQKKAYFEAHYKKIAERKAEIMDQDKNSSFRSVVTDQGSVEEGENGGFRVDEGSNEKFTCEEDKHVIDIAAATAAEVKGVNVVELDDEETIFVKECQTSVDEVKEEVKDSQESDISTLVEEKSEVVEVKPEEIVLEKEKPVEALQEATIIIEEVASLDDLEDTNETPIKEAKKVKNQNLIKKNDRKVQVNPTRGSLKPNQVTTKPTVNKTLPSKKTPPSKEIRSTTKKPAASISKSTQVYSTPIVYKPITSLSTSFSSVKKENVSSGLLRSKQTGPKSLHISMSHAPSTSDPSPRKSLIMERMGDKDIVKRAFKTFQKSYDLNTSVNDHNTALKQKPTKASSVEKRSNTNTPRGLKSNTAAEKQQKTVEKTRVQKNPKAGVMIDAKPRRDSLNKPKAKPMQGSLQVRASPKGPLEKVL